MSNVKSGEDIGWELFQQTERLAALLDTIDNLECFMKGGLPDEVVRAHRLISVASELAKSAENWINHFYEAYTSLESRLSRPKEGDKLPGELLHELLQAVTCEGESASLIAMKASELARYAEGDPSLKPALEYMMELIRQQGFTTKLKSYQGVGCMVEIYRQREQSQP